MYLDVVGTFALLLIGCHAIPSGYILKVEHQCGTKGQSGVTGANVTLTSDLLTVQGTLTCNNGSGFPATVAMPAITEKNTFVSSNLYYPGDPNGITGKDCFFLHPSSESNVYVVKLEVYWGFKNASLMEDYETYTLTCITNGEASQTLGQKIINENQILLTDGYVHNVGDQYIGSSALRLMDVLGNEIAGDELPLGKRVYLNLTISGGSEKGLTPFDCYAKSGADKRYKILNSGCGDGIILKKNAGFSVKGKIAISPYFKIFKLIDYSGTPGISYSCSFTTCNNTCDGSSCSLPVNRKRRSTDNRDVETAFGMVSTTNYNIQSTNALPATYVETEFPTCALPAIPLCILALSLFVLIFGVCSGYKRRESSPPHRSECNCQEKETSTEYPERILHC